jgi:hypothetical protein
MDTWILHDAFDARHSNRMQTQESLQETVGLNVRFPLAIE